MCAIAFIRARDTDLLTFECSANERLILQLTRGTINTVGSFSHYDIIVLCQCTCFSKYAQVLSCVLACGFGTTKYPTIFTIVQVSTGALNNRETTNPRVQSVVLLSAHVSLLKKCPDSTNVCRNVLNVCAPILQGTFTLSANFRSMFQVILQMRRRGASRDGVHVLQDTFGSGSGSEPEEDQTRSETSDEPQFFSIVVKAGNSQFVFRSVDSSFPSLFYPPFQLLTGFYHIKSLRLPLERSSEVLIVRSKPNLYPC